MYYLIMGATCAGKDKIASYIVDNFENYKTLISTTSRPIRPNEKEGVEYYFISKEEFLKRIEAGELIEYRTYETTVNGIKDVWYYGLEKKHVTDMESNYVVVIDYKGGLEFQEYIGKENTFMIYVESKYTDRYVRNVLRGDFNSQEWLRRNKDDAAWLLKAAEDAQFTLTNYGFNYPPNPNKNDKYAPNTIDIPMYEEEYDFSYSEDQVHIILNSLPNKKE